MGAVGNYFYKVVISKLRTKGGTGIQQREGCLTSAHGGNTTHKDLETRKHGIWLGNCKCLYVMGTKSTEAGPG